MAATNAERAVWRSARGGTGVRPIVTSIRRRLLSAAALLALTGLAREAAAGNTCTWTGGSSTFASAGNWSNCGFTYPGSADTAQFNGTSGTNCSIPSGTTLAGLTITNAYTGTVSLGASLTVAGSFSVNGSNLNAGTGTVTLTGTSSASLKSGNDVLNNLIVNATGTYTQTGALKVGGTLTITAGTLSTSSFATAIAGDLSMSGGTLTGGTGTTTVGGNVTVANAVTNGSDPSLVGYWNLDETASPAADSSGQHNSLVWNSSPAAITSVPSSITFTDSHSLSMTGTQYAGTSSTLASISKLTPATVTVSAWYKASHVDSSGGEIISGSNTYGLRITSTGAVVMKRISDNTAAADWIEYRVSLSNVLDGNWHQITGVIQPGTGGSMALYFDGVVASGAYWVNGSSGATQLSSSTIPTATTAAAAAIDWDANTESFGLIVGTNPSTGGYQFGAGCSAGACAIDDVRVYNRALTAAEVAALAHGNQPGGTTGVLSLSGVLSVGGSVSIEATGTLTLTSGGTLKVGTALTMDGTLNATGGTIQAASAGTSYAFKVGSIAAAAPELNINGLTVANTDSNGMWINANTGAATTFTRFDSLAFGSGTGNQLLHIYASSLFLTSNGCTFDSSATYAVKLTGNGTGSGAGPRALFGNAACGTNDSTSGLCATSEKSDDDANNDGVADHPTTNGAVVQFVRGSQSDTDGTIVGFPTAAFDWSTFTYYATYVAFHDASGGSDVVYVRDPAGNPLYEWVDPTTDESIVGTPQWITSGGIHYLYVAANGGASNSGKIYRLTDSATGDSSGKLILDPNWASSGAYACSCTITSNLSLDASNIYWAATNGAQVLMGITQSSGAKISTSWPVTTPANVTTSSPALFIKSGTTTLYLGITNDLLQLAVTGTTFVQNTKPGTITGRVSVGTSLLTSTLNTSRVYAGDSSGTMWAISPTSFTGTNFLWSYASGGGITNNSYDAATDTVQFGTSGGKVVVMAAANGALLSGYPYTLDTTDPITAAPLYYNGVLAVGTSKGKLYFLDRNTGSGVSILRTYSFGAGQSISTVAFDPTSYRYMVSTSSAAADGRLYYFDLVSDPTPSST